MKPVKVVYPPRTGGTDITLPTITVNFDHIYNAAFYHGWIWGFATCLVVAVLTLVLSVIL